MKINTKYKLTILHIQSQKMNTEHLNEYELEDEIFSLYSYVKYEQIKIGLAKIMILAKILQISSNPAAILPK